MELKLIGRKRRFMNRAFIQCDCGEEILEFVQDKNDEDGSIEYLVVPYCELKNTKDKCSAFMFENKGAFSFFVGELRNFVNDVDSDSIPVLYDKYLSYRNREPGVLMFMYTNSDDKERFFGVRKYMNPRCVKKGKPTWEMVIGKTEAKELLEELEKFS